MTVKVFCGEFVREYETAEKIKASDFLKKEGVFFAMPCGGHGKCLNCKIKITGKISPAADVEKSVLNEEELECGMRLACFTVIEGDCEITLEGRQENVMSDFFGSVETLSDGQNEGIFGVAADIGTTTVCAYIFSLADGKMISKRAAKNAQTLFGSDVISRIEASLGGERESLRKLICGQIDSMVKEMSSESGIPDNKIKKAVLTGNTAMLYMLTGKSTDSISKAPFISETLFGGDYREEIFIDSLKYCDEIYLPGCMGAYVGADITCAVESSGMAEKNGNILLADIGTNGEIVLKHGDKMLGCSTAAGPAFEGSGLSCGVTAGEGAISHVKITDEGISYETVGESSPTGFCGSGIVDAVAVMLEKGIIDETGRIDDIFITEKNGEEYVEICGFYVSQKDIRSIQMGKAAICGGIMTLLKKEGLSPEDIDEMLIAGGFGSFLDVESSGRIGLIPHELVKKAKAIGNAAAKGAADILLAPVKKGKSKMLSETVLLHDLTSDPDFSEIYIENMMFC